MPNFMTRATYERMNSEMLQIQQKEIPRMSKAKQAAAEEGDLKENAEYHACKEKLEQLQARYLNLQERLAGVAFIDDLNIPGTVVSLGTVVEFENEESGEKKQYTLLGSEDADLDNGIISISSPIAKGMIGKKEGQSCQIQVPEGTLSVKVLSITKFKKD